MGGGIGKRKGGGGGSDDGSDKGGGGGASSSKTGGFVVLNEADFVTVFEARDAKKVSITASNVFNVAVFFVAKGGRFGRVRSCRWAAQYRRFIFFVKGARLGRANAALDLKRDGYLASMPSTRSRSITGETNVPFQASSSGQTAKHLKS